MTLILLFQSTSTCECNRISFEASLKWICWVGLVQSAKKVLIWCKGCSFSATNFKSHFYPTTSSTQPIFLLHHHPTHAHNTHDALYESIESNQKDYKIFLKPYYAITLSSKYFYVQKMLIYRQNAYFRIFFILQSLI